MLWVLIRSASQHMFSLRNKKKKNTFWLKKKCLIKSYGVQVAESLKPLTRDNEVLNSNPARSGIPFMIARCFFAKNLLLSPLHHLNMT